ncbi:MAG: alpha/beta hydrolase [Alphaproteobacteria bacterium]
MSLYADTYFSAPDGLRLYYRDYDRAAAGLTPVLCLPGLTRNARDFDAIAAHLSASRRVIAPDMRGRGRSAYDPNWQNYSIPVETGDVLALAAALGLEKVAIIGTSRGGLIASVIAAMKPALLKGVVLNDVGPELDPRGIARITAYVGRQDATPPDWTAAMEGLKTVNDGHFEMDDAQWMSVTRAIFRDENGKPVLDYDPKIGDATRASMAQPQTFDPWMLFKAFAPIPLLVIRGANSDVLSAETVAKMREAKPDMRYAEIPKRGHAPLLDEPESIAAIDAFLAELG